MMDRLTMRFEYSIQVTVPLKQNGTYCEKDNPQTFDWFENSSNILPVASNVLSWGCRQTYSISVEN